jgi:hypothetical protein
VLQVHSGDKLEVSKCFRSRQEQSSSTPAVVLSTEGQTRVMQDRMEMAGSVKKGEIIFLDFSSYQAVSQTGYLRLPVEIGLGYSLSSPLGTIARTIALRTASARIAEKG